MDTRNALRVTKDKVLSFAPSTLLNVVVGVEPNQKRFSIHESIICARSEFFRRAMSGDWLEKEERLINLPEDDADIFALYINVVYMNQVPTNAAAESKTPKVLCDEMHELCALYVLCEKLQDKMGKNAILRTIMATGKELATDGRSYSPRPATVTVMYAGSPAGSPGRKLFAEMWTGLPQNFFVGNAQQLPKDFIIDFAAVLLDAKPTQRRSWKDNESKFLERLT